MAEQHIHSPDRRWHGCMLVSLLIVLTAWTSAWPLRSPGRARPVVVHAGQLSVAMREAPVREVLAAIAQQAGLHIYIDASANRTVNVEFADMALDQGLRRLLRAASRSYTLLYTRGSAATDILQEVRVFGEKRGEVPASHNGDLLLPAWLAVHSQRSSHELFPHGVVRKILKAFV